MPPTENQNPAPAPVLAPAQPPAAPISPAPSTAPAGMPPTGGIPPKKKMGVGAKIALTLGVLFFLSLAGIVVFNVIGRLQNAKKTSTEGSISSSTTPSVNTTAADLNCGVTLSRYPTNPDKAYVMNENWPIGFQMHDTGDEDSAREYCQGAKLKTRAEEFVTALGKHDYETAFTYVAKADAALPKAQRVASWNGEYGKYTFDPKNYPLDYPTGRIDYAVEPCYKDFGAGWSKNIKNGYYRTPVLKLDAANGVTTQISLAMTLEDSQWKVAGENNELHNAAGVVEGDAYANGQASRDYSNFWTCGN